MNTNAKGHLIIGISLLLSFIILGIFINSGIEKFKAYERTVTVKGLSEREVPADLAIWPITYDVASNSISDLYDELDQNQKIVRRFLKGLGFEDNEITLSIPFIVDKLARQYGNSYKVPFRFTGSQSVTVCSKKVDLVKKGMKKLIELGKKGIIFSGNEYENRPQFLFTRLNDIKPKMIEEATIKARQVALKFAKDSDSRLGKIKRARQGQFSIRDRDENTPYIKKVRVVSTIEYYLVD